MSYILDALRKAERERNLGRPPSLQTVAQPQATVRNRRRGLVPVVVVVTLLLLAAMATLLWNQGRSASAASPPPAVVDIPAAAPADPAPAMLETPAIEAPDDAVASLDDLAAPQEQPPESAAVEELPPPAGQDEAGAALAVVARPAPPPRPVVDETEEPEEDAIPLLRDLPASYRADFPPLTVEIHVYDDDVAKRWVMVNARRYREGEALSEGPRIAEITPDGIVFDHRGQRALYPIAR